VSGASQVGEDFDAPAIRPIIKPYRRSFTVGSKGDRAARAKESTGAWRRCDDLPGDGN